jgi:uncharacterized protein
MADNIFEQAVIDQQQEVEAMDHTTLTTRYDERKVDIHSKLAQIVIGVRRSGKSTLCHKVLLQQNIKYAYLNFDDERLKDITSDQLNDVLSALYAVYGDFKHLFLDEIQNVEGWHLFVNRLLRQGIKLLITGSNANLLSSELSTYLTGRYVQIELFPFSFNEYLLFKKMKLKAVSTKDVALRDRAYLEYLEQGGFPELFDTVTQKMMYVQGLFQAIIYKDILKRFQVKYVKAFGDIAYWALNNFAREISYAQISKNFDIKSVHTAQNYISYLEQGYLIMTLPKFSFKAQERVRNNKTYIIDTAFINFAQDKVLGTEYGWRLENIVYLELRRRRNWEIYDLYFYKNTYEIDFVKVVNGKPKELIQVAYLMEDKKTRNREINALLKATTELKCKNLTIITQGRSEEYKEDNVKINIVNIVEWLCGYEYQL